MGYHRATQANPGSGEGMLPHGISQVRQTWRTHGSEAATRKVCRQLAEKGRAYIVVCLKALGKARWAVLKKRNPNAQPYPYTLPSAAVAAFDLHVGFLEGALTIQGYLEYAGAAGADSDDKHTPPCAPKSKQGAADAGERDTRGAAKAALTDGALVLQIAIRGRRHLARPAAILLCEGSQGASGRGRARVRPRRGRLVAPTRRAAPGVQALRQSRARELHARHKRLGAPGQEPAGLSLRREKGELLRMQF
eukprot:6200721-Pleurochrysis_carterae.AAC.1